MPLKRKLIKVGDSRAVVLPAEWLKFYEDKLGKEIENVFIEVNNIITIAVKDESERASERK